jgi:hypothetical protein
MELRKRPLHFDSIGLLLLSIVMVCWEVMLSKGQEWDWLSDLFWCVQMLAILFASGLVGLIFRELRSPNPVVNVRPLGERNFSARRERRTSFQCVALKTSMSNFVPASLADRFCCFRLPFSSASRPAIAPSAPGSGSASAGS